MKKLKLTYIFLSIYAGTVCAQTKEDVNLDVLKAPSSPAAQLLGFAIADVEKPTDLSSFMVTIQSASSAFSKLPNNYAVDLAPFSLLRRKNYIALNGKNSLQSTDVPSVIKQSLVVSFAIRNPDTAVGNFIPKNSYAAIGLKFSIIRPQFSDDNLVTLQQIRLNSLDRIRLTQSRLSAADVARKLKIIDQQEDAEIERLLAKYSGKVELDIDSVLQIERGTPGTTLNTLASQSKALVRYSEAEVEKSAEAAAITARLRLLAGQFDAKRVGFSWDVAGGIGLNFRDKRFDNSKVYNSGIWTTIGYNLEKAGSILALARLMMNPDQIYAIDNASNPYTQDINTFDAGARYVLSSKRFGCSLEGIHRSIINTDLQQSTWRVVFNTDYTIAPNQKLLFSFGRNFDGTYTKSNNLIASLSLLFGFGGTKI
jgi:hypothetical protein